jgi:hypothetical protein
MVDEAARRVYHWEDSFVEPRQSASDRLLTREQCRRYVEMACAVTGTRIPFVRFSKASHLPCRADLLNWEIMLSEWGHAAVPVLHETAHLATASAVARGENGHGPSFARMAIEFYAMFLRIDRDYLLTTAQRCGVSVGPPISRLVLPSNESPFTDEDF